MTIPKDLINPLTRLALSMYVGDRCKYCDREYVSVDEIIELNVVRADGEEFRLACNICYESNLRGKE